MLQKPQIAIDLCNTVCDVNRQLEIQFHTKRSFGNYWIDGVTDSFFESTPSFFILPEVFPYAVESLQLLSRYYKITYLTARPKVAEAATRYFLMQNRFPDGEIIFTNDKVSYFLNHHMVFSIDDAPKEIAGYHAHNIPVLIKAWDYNIGMGTRFEWKELYTYILYGNNVTDLFALSRSVTC